MAEETARTLAVISNPIGKTIHDLVIIDDRLYLFLAADGSESAVVEATHAFHKNKIGFIGMNPHDVKRIYDYRHAAKHKRERLLDQIDALQQELREMDS